MCCYPPNIKPKPCARAFLRCADVIMQGENCKYVVTPIPLPVVLCQAAHVGDFETQVTRIKMGADHQEK